MPPTFFTKNLSECLIYMYRKPLEMFFVNFKATLFFRIFAKKIIQIRTHAISLKTRQHKKSHNDKRDIFCKNQQNNISLLADRQAGNQQTGRRGRRQADRSSVEPRARHLFTERKKGDVSKAVNSGGKAELKSV